MFDLVSSLEPTLRSGSPLAYLAAFGGGVLASLTPCAYPLIPVTVAYLGSRRTRSGAIGFLLSAAYALGIAVTYAALGGVAALTGRIFGEVAVHPLTHFFVPHTPRSPSPNEIPKTPLLTQSQSASHGPVGAVARPRRPPC